MAEYTAQDAIQQRWDPAMTAQAVRLLKWAAVVQAAIGVVALIAIAAAGLVGHPLVVFFLLIGPLLGAGGALDALLIIRYHRVIGRLLFRFGLPVFVSAIIGIVLFAWAVALAFRLVDHIAADPVVSAVEATTAFGGELTIEKIQLGLLGQHDRMVGVRPGDGLMALFAYLLWPLQFRPVRDAIIAVGVLGFVSLVAVFSIWWERKVAGRIQSRLGPMRVGGWHGWAQGIADGLKLIQKEDIHLTDADRPLFRIAPYLAFVPAIAAFVALPFGAAWVLRDLDVGLLFILAMLGIDVVGVLIGGWASNNKWSVYGAMREACQMVSYEIPMGMALLVPVMTVGTLDLTRIGEAQGGGFHDWLAFSNPFTFAAAVLYYVSSLASCKRAPFDLPEAESELVAGFHTEYSGFRWAVFFFGEYAAMFLVSALATILFFGAWHSPLPASWGESLLAGGVPGHVLYGLLFNGPLWFVAKAMGFIFIQIWMRWTLPRIRIDQVMYACVQVLLPLAMVVLLGNTLWLLLVRAGGWVDRLANALCTLAAVGLLLGFVLIALSGWVNRKRLVGRLVVDHLPGS